MSLDVSKDDKQSPSPNKVLQALAISCTKEAAAGVSNDGSTASTKANQLLHRLASAPVVTTQREEGKADMNALPRASSTSHTDHAGMSVGINETIKGVTQTQQNVQDAMQRAQQAINSAKDFDAKWKEFQQRFQRVIDASLDGVRAGLREEAGGELDVENALSDDQKAAVFAGKEPSLRAFANLLKKCNKVVVVMGAGCSTNAGIPDFRSPVTGLYAKLASENLPRPESLFDISVFKSDPSHFNKRAKHLWPGVHKPTIAHKLVRELDKRGMLLRCYTQNIDGLEYAAQVQDNKVVQCHGGFRSARCVECKAEADIDEVKKEIMKEGTPKCVSCKGYIKPDIVFFGENLPQIFVDLHAKDMKEADAVIVMGTSLNVRPVSLLPSLAKPDAPRLLINRETVGPFVRPHGKKNYRDVCVLGDVDEGALSVAKEMGWEL